VRTYVWWKGFEDQVNFEPSVRGIVAENGEDGEDENDEVTSGKGV